MVIINEIVSDSKSLVNEASALLMLIVPLLFVLGGLLLLVPGIPKKTGKQVLAYAFFFTFLSALGPMIFPLLFNILSGLPWWLLVFVLCLMMISVFQAFVAVFIGWRGANSFAGNLAASLFKAIFSVLIIPFHLLRKLFGNAE